LTTGRRIDKLKSNAEANGAPMKPPTPNGINRPFEALEGLFQARRTFRLSASPRAPAPVPGPTPALDEEALFFEAMTGVQRMPWNAIEGNETKPAPPNAASSEETVIGPLRQLVDRGLGFSVADTPEYMEGVGCSAPPEITRRLHRGDFSVQAHVDLHGFCAEAAQEVFDAFMRDAVATGKRTVLIIHGRGLSSPEQPVLKTRVAGWLTRGYWRKWVVAFASARLCDGGSGASYVLLRRRPASKRLRRRWHRRAQTVPYQ
jgi:DNA-nicking Smr family endonuclease